MYENRFRVMRWSGAKVVSSVLLIAGPLVFCACADLVVPRPFALSRAHIDEVSPWHAATSARFLPWAEDQSQIIVVDKTTRELALYRHGKRVKSYPVVLGRNPGRKMFEGDRRTPSGLYHVIAKRPHPKYDRFLDLDYPNDGDIAQYDAALHGGVVPAVLGHRRGTGGLVGIHGSDKENFNRLGIDWTFGCVSLANRDVEDLYDEVTTGTPVLIRDDQQP
jgi:murein L,D-transpeptidase YafK